MSHNILITGASGYLGGTLLAHLESAGLPSHDKIYALVRTDAQAAAVKEYSAEPLTFDAFDEDAVRANVLDKKISVVLHLIDALNSTSQEFFIRALGDVKKSTGTEVHFLHTSGAKIFSSHAGAPTDRPLSDAEPGLFETQKGQKAPFPFMATAVNTNNTVIEQAEKYGVRAYVFVPCIVYGKGEGFGNKISIQTVAVVKAAKVTRHLYRTDEGRPTWPVSHIQDTTTLYLALLRSILASENPDHGKNGYYHATSGSVAWDDLYAALGAALLKRGLVDDVEIRRADQAALEKMGVAMGYPAEMVGWAIGGKCTFTGDHGKKLGWKPQYKPEHILDDAENEAELILSNLE
ncbi:hypothetical protein BJ170DRAFT_364891 [Xylariales sp. AK1849]|nr:hypothetical protein BJ170DRAFT_364891 [Xylariales sp. AK1849]